MKHLASMFVILVALGGCRSASCGARCATGPACGDERSSAQRGRPETATVTGGANLIELAKSPQALRDRFNAEKDRVRVVALLSPV